MIAAINVRSLALISALFLAGPTVERYDVYTPSGVRTGYVQVDPRTGRADWYDTAGNRLGYGRVTAPDGRIDLYRPDGTRTKTVVPPRVKGAR